MTYIALLRAVNVGGRGKVGMTELRAMCADLGLGAPRTLLNSGNLVFERTPIATGRLEALLEAEAERRFGHRPDVLVRTAAEWDEIIADNPFPREAADDPARLVVMPLKGEVVSRTVGALQARIDGPEVVKPGKRAIYVVYPAGMGTSRLTNAVIERALETRGTARNWNTVLKLATLAAERRA